MTSLTESALERYRTDGYTTLTDVFPPEHFAALRDHFEHRLASLPDGARPEDMDVPHFTDPALFEWLLDPGVLDIVEQILGPDIALFSAHF